MASLLLKNGYIITVNGNRDVIRNGWICIEGDSIRGIGPMEKLACRGLVTAPTKPSTCTG